MGKGSEICLQSKSQFFDILCSDSYAVLGSAFFGEICCLDCHHAYDVLQTWISQAMEWRNGCVFIIRVMESIYYDLFAIPITRMEYDNKVLPTLSVFLVRV